MSKKKMLERVERRIRRIEGLQLRLRKKACKLLQEETGCQATCFREDDRFCDNVMEWSNHD